VGGFGYQESGIRVKRQEITVWNGKGRLKEEVKEIVDPPGS
jgi:hypothetical protein